MLLLKWSLIRDWSFIAVVSHHRSHKICIYSYYFLHRVRFVSCMYLVSRTAKYNYNNICIKYGNLGLFFVYYSCMIKRLTFKLRRKSGKTI